MNNIISFIKPEPVQYQHFCSFCKRMEYSVRSLIKSGLNNHCICSNCIRHCKTRIDETMVITDKTTIEIVQYD